MTELLTAAQMRAVEAAAIAAGAVTGLELMERAGAGTVEATLARWPRLAARPARAVVLCGPGNNGGDGWVIARLLRERDWRVDALAFGDPATAPSDAAEMRRRWERLGAVRPLGDLRRVLPGADLLVDALFGAGLSRPLPAEVEDAFSAVPYARDETVDEDGRADPETEANVIAAGDDWTWPMVVAVDGPSGLCLDTGRARGPVRRADLTVTFHRAKPGHYLERGPDLCGTLAVADIGLEAFAANARAYPELVSETRYALVDPPFGAARKETAWHKYDHGHVLVLAGGPGRGGAARLAARAALRVGAGLVTVGAPSEAMTENAARLDAIMLRRIDGPEDLTEALRDERIKALVIGPGLGVGPHTRKLVLAACGAGADMARLPGIVLDADALTSLAQHHAGFDPANQQGLWRLAHPGVEGERIVMTPHHGEFVRLFPGYRQGWQVMSADQSGASPPRLMGKAQAVKGMANFLSVTLLLKGRDTVIAGPDGKRVSIHAAAYGREAPWLATAGAGDVLAGLIAGLLARGFAPLPACAAAAWLHVEAARHVGPGLIAEDLPEALPAVLRALMAAPDAP